MLKTIKTKNIIYFLFLLYLIAISAYQLGVGFDALFVRLSFSLFVILTILFSKRVEITGLLKWCLLFWGFYFLSMIWAKNPNDTLYYFNNAIQDFGIFISVPLLMKERKDIDKVLVLILISLTYMCILLILRTPHGIWGTDYLGQVIGMHRNIVGVRLSIGFIACMYLLSEELSAKKKLSFKIVLLLIVSILFVAIILLTGSKKALLSLFLGFISYQLVNSKGMKAFFKFVFIVLSCIVVTYLIFSVPILYNALGSRLEHLYLTVIGSAKRWQVDGSLLERQFYINEAIKLFKMHPVIGYGGNNFLQYLREIGYYKHIAYSHNNFFELLSTLGVMGFIIYYSMWLAVLLRLLNNYSNSKTALGLFFAIVIIIILILDYANVSYISDFNMIVLALATSYLKISENVGGKNEKS